MRSKAICLKNQNIIWHKHGGCNNLGNILYVAPQVLSQGGLLHPFNNILTNFEIPIKHTHIACALAPPAEICRTNPCVIQGNRDERGQASTSIRLHTF